MTTPPDEGGDATDPEPDPDPDPEPDLALES